MPFDDHGFVVPGAFPATRIVPPQIERPPYVGLQTPPPYTGDNTYSDDEIRKIREAGRIASRALDAVGAAVAHGVTTAELDRIGHEFVVGSGAYPSTLGYRGYRASTCTSVNEVICHGIPDDTVLREGDIVNVDITAYLDGYHGDTNRTFRVGTVGEEVDLLIERTHEAMMRGIKAAKPGREVNVIGRVIETYAKRFGYGVVRDFTGHGVGSAFHSGLIIPHYDSAPRFNDVIVPGMVFTVEPMLTLGTHEWEMWDDNWTVVTKDKSITAQFEHTIVVRENGFELLTISD
ncbi:type I methionyl aminopeptidase [Leucobacter denitrificans]|uniref:Methionine aminopeptidase n=1 Tax=Leucobacter denitrificans TaxID=683042 RepID=A0A7G9S5M2_9MICO|nr:type I methionyl aminopeptidase [Leucobacter denitrificans]QNN63147.1 type I methionyl aminopeptidase [Leucobacter denitrificans]